MSRQCRFYARSTTIATPFPPPRQREATPIFGPVLHRVEERRQHSCAAGADRVAERDGPAVDVHLARDLRVLFMQATPAKRTLR